MIFRQNTEDLQETGEQGKYVMQIELLDRDTLRKRLEDTRLLSNFERLDILLLLTYMQN